MWELWGPTMVLGEPTASRDVSASMDLATRAGECVKHGGVLHTLGDGDNAAGLLCAQ